MASPRCGILRGRQFGTKGTKSDTPVEVVELLIRSGANLYAKTIDGYNAKQLAEKLLHEKENTV